MRSVPARAGLVLLVFALLAVVIAARGVISGPPDVSSPQPTEASSVAAASTPATSPSGEVAESSPIDTADWQTVRVHTLGYSLQLPPTFEVVGNDPSTPVPSIDAIRSIAPTVADGLTSQAQRIESEPGVFGELGLWSIEPDSLSQVGLLAGEPYRVAAADLQGIVESAAAGRATPLEGSSVDAVELPAGDGFLASYRDESDLGAHREIHLRTPNGRYLILVMAFADPTPTAADEQRFLAIAGSLAPLAGDETGDVPPPPVTPADHADPGLEGLLPDSVGGVPIEKRSLDGEDLVGGGTTAGTVLDAVASLVPVPGRVTVALGVPSSGSSKLVITAFALHGVGEAAINARLAQFPSEIWSTQLVGGRSALVSVAGSDGRQTYLRVSGDALEEVVTSDPKEAAEVLAALG